MKKIKTSIDLLSLIMGALLATWILILLYIFVLSKRTITVSDSTTPVATTTISSEDDTEVTYNTSITDWEVTLNSGETVNLHTPEDFYSLSDQYMVSLASYYGVDDMTSDSIVVVGDNANTFSSGTIINADSLSDVASMLSQIYGEDVDTDSIVNSEAYTYMTTGELPSDLPLNYEIEELDTYTVNGIEFVVYEVNYDTEYYSSDDTDEDSTEIAEVETEVVHTQQISCYSKTEDSLEIIIYQDEFDRDAALSLLKEFLGVEE